MSATDPQRGLYPPIEPFDHGRLKVDDRHEISYQQVGNPAGKPALVVHGGPGGGLDPVYRQVFDPAAWRVVLFDQRGCGRSTPHADLTDNTTWHLVADIERLRRHLGIARWLVFGGSWGSTLSLAYAETHPAHVSALVLRGIFLLRAKELGWFYQEGAGAVFPDYWADYVAEIPPDQRHDMIAAYYRRLTGDDPAVRLSAARAWSRWEASTVSLLPDPERIAAFTDERFATAFARIECHYFINRGFFAHDGWLLDQVGAIRAIPGVIVQGRYDMVTPMMSSWDLHKAWPEADYRIVPDAGHAFGEPGITDALIRATDRFRS